MRIYYTDHFTLPLPAGHRFPVEKYARLRARVQSRLADVLAVAEAASLAELGRVHDERYLRQLIAGELSPAAIRRIGFPWSPAMVERSRRSVGATLAACRSALRAPGAASACAINLAGGTHHAFSDHGEGYCVFNDAAVATRAVQAEGLARRVAIVDLDVHQGNGTAAILAGDPNAFTFSIHGERNFPFRKETSDWDIALPDGTGDAEYLDCLRRALPAVFARARPELVIYLAGADAYAGDRLGRLALGKRGLAERDRMVLGACREHAVPVAIAMAGGYAEDIDDVVDIHYATVATAWSMFGDGRVLDWPQAHADTDVPPIPDRPPAGAATDAHTNTGRPQAGSRPP
jgi:acetoin utilization deacetylase AcuC-like enzyme